VVGASSSSIYGNQPELPKRETQLPRPLSPYAASKLALEHLFLSYASCYTLSTVSLRYFNVFGPRQRADSQYAAVVPAFTKRLLAGEAPIIHGDGLQTRDFTFVANAVLATLLAGSTTTPLKGEAVNVASGVQATLLDCALKLAAICQAPPHLHPTHAPERAGDVRHSVADISLAKSLLGYEPVCSFEEGLAETVEWSRHEADAAGT
jgi:nucleoside-diphosphate-sugar epimerase